MFITRIRITVLKADVMDELASVYGQLQPDGTRTTHPCPFFHPGDKFEFSLKGGISGGPFCEMAKNDLFTMLTAMAGTGSATPAGQKKDIPPQICCCSDGLRPVFFKLEVMEPDELL
ncbi:MAG: TIGR04076 family protein [Butyricicoccus sp.]